MAQPTFSFRGGPGSLMLGERCVHVLGADTDDYLPDVQDIRSAVISVGTL
jgi:hypothetical protein